MISQELIVTVILQDILEAWHSNKSYSLFLQVMPYILQHIFRVWLMFKEIELYKGIERTIWVLIVTFRKAFIDLIADIREIFYRFRCFT